jgi:hypothetical protein
LAIALGWQPVRILQDCGPAQFHTSMAEQPDGSVAELRGEARDDLAQMCAQPSSTHKK